MLLSGYSKDLGMYMPEEIPALGFKELQALSGCSYTELVCKIARKFIDEDEIPTEDLEGELAWIFAGVSLGSEAVIRQLTH